MATPFLGATFALPDAGNDPPDASSRQAYDLMSEGFGPGSSGPLLVLANLGSEPDGVIERLRTGLSDTDGIAAVSPARINATGDTGLITVIPSTGPQAPETADLTRVVRESVIPTAVEGSGATAFVVWHHRDEHRPERVPRGPPAVPDRRCRRDVDPAVARGVPQPGDRVDGRR